MPASRVEGMIPLSGRPNNVAISKDGRRVYVAIISGPGAVDVIDTTSLEQAGRVLTRGGVHNTYVTPDGKHVVAGSISGRNFTESESLPMGRRYGSAARSTATCMAIPCPI